MKVNRFNGVQLEYRPQTPGSIAEAASSVGRYTRVCDAGGASLWPKDDLLDPAVTAELDSALTFLGPARALQRLNGQRVQSGMSRRTCRAASIGARAVRAMPETTRVMS